MLIDYGSFAYCFYLLLPFAITVALYFVLRRRSMRTKKIVIFCILIANFIQHVLKTYIYPQYDGGFSYNQTAYNMCAFLILVSPFIFLCKNDFLKDAIFFFGTAAGITAMAIPHWFIGKTAFDWEVYRFYICHGLLLVGSLLPVLLGAHRINYRNFWKLPFFYFIAEIIILLNDSFFIITGYGGFSYTAENLYEALYNLNPVWSMHPHPDFAVLNNIIDFFTPDFFWRNAAGEEAYFPVLWSAIPIYLLITVLGFILSVSLDFRHAKQDFIRLKNKIRQAVSRLNKKEYKQ